MLIASENKINPLLDKLKQRMLAVVEMLKNKQMKPERLHAHACTQKVIRRNGWCKRGLYK